MTAQMCDFFEYQGLEYCLMGFTGGHLTNAWDFGMHFRGASTADARGFCMIYGIDEVNRLVVKRIEIRGEEITPITHCYHAIRDDNGGEFYGDINQVIPLTGWLLFSNVWVVRHLYLDSIDPDGNQYQLFEAAVDKGVVTGVRDCADEVRQNLRGHKRGELGTIMFSGKTNEERLSNYERSWNTTASFLPHRYDTLYAGIWYFPFRETIEELRRKISSSKLSEDN